MDKHKRELIEQRKENEYLMNKYNKHIGVTPGKKIFSICTIDRKSFKSFDKATAWQKHVEREVESANVDFSKSKYNRVLIGPPEGFTLGQYLKEHTSCVKLRKNAALARTIVLTSSHKFQEQFSDAEMELWINQNLKFIKEHFGESCIYACLHANDETTTHLHIMVSNVEYDEKKRKFFLRNDTFFGSREKLIALQDTYYKYMSEKFNCFKRPLRGSKAKHIDLKTFYNIMNEKIDTNNLTPKQVESIVKDNFLLNKRYQDQQKTIEALSNNNEMDELLDEIEELKNDNTVYKKVIKDIADNLGLDKNIILQLAEKHEKENKSSKNKQRERKIK